MKLINIPSQYLSESQLARKRGLEVVEVIEIGKRIALTDENLEKYRLSDAADTIYHFMWDEIADKYIEDVKKREVPAEKEICLSVLSYVFANCLKLLHPFMPFVTEEIWNNLSGILAVGEEKKPLIASSWPK